MDMKTCAVVNVIESSIARDSEFVLPIHCGTEIGVAFYKSFFRSNSYIIYFSFKIRVNER